MADIQNGTFIRCIRKPGKAIKTPHTVSVGGTYKVTDVRLRPPVEKHKAQTRVRLEGQPDIWFLIGNFEAGLDPVKQERIKALEQELSNLRAGSGA